MTNPRSCESRTKTKGASVDVAFLARCSLRDGIDKYAIDLILVRWNFRNVTLHSLLSLQRPFWSTYAFLGVSNEQA